MLRFPQYAEKTIMLLYLLMVWNVAPAQINRVEYFFDTDPGFGLATAIPVAAATNIADQNAAISLAGIATGFHNLHIRSRDIIGKWSVTNQVPFYKIASGPAANIDRVEYFFDTDPGFGSGTALSIASGINISEQVATVSLSAVQNGFHNLYLRSRDASGKWSVTNQVPFYKLVPPSPNTIQRVEYFIDTDPRFGLAIPISTTASANIADQSFTVDLGMLSTGTHNLFIRSKDTSGCWSITNQVAFQVGAPLPVSILYFSATSKKWDALLNWSTITESNSRNFLIERSIDGIHFTTIGTIAAAGQSVVQRNYQFTDDLSAFVFQPVKVYYRLQMVDKDDSRKASTIVSVNVGETKYSLSLLQNPVQSQATLQYISNNTTQKATLQITDQLGKLLFVKPVDVTAGINRYYLETASFTKGVYIIQLISSSNKISSIKMIKN